MPDTLNRECNAMNLTRRNFLVTGAAGLAGVALSCSAWADLAGSAASADPAATAHAGPPMLGDEKAAKRLVAWGSLTCPYTATLYGILTGIVTDLSGSVCVEWRHFPTHPPDPALHVAALGFQGQHFWGFVSRVLNEVYAQGGGYDTLTPSLLAEFAKAEGGSGETLKAAYADAAKWTAVKEDMLAGRLLGITRTPGLFYNGYFMTPEGMPLDLAAFDKSLRTMIKTG
ncbi:MAG: hypothetical protein EPN97_09095 [Alphaproteobacteria bacterium]|nr:MAG: hypothetical protein EPN97_09095 [Alphaproteobacteria bacterium]